MIYSFDRTLKSQIVEHDFFYYYYNMVHALVQCMAFHIMLNFIIYQISPFLMIVCY